MTLYKSADLVLELPGAITVATDGSCLTNPDGPTGWAFYAEDGEYGYGGLEEGTNNIGELLAVQRVLEHYPSTPLVIQADSAYTIGCASTWAAGWARNGWKNSKKEPVANLGIVQDIYALMQARAANDVPVHFQKVKAHLKDVTIWPLNVKVDELAGIASQRAKHGVTEPVYGLMAI